MWRRVLAVLAAAMLGTGLGAPVAGADMYDHYALLLVWMPGLCKLEADRAECKDLSLRRYDGRNLAFMALESARESGLPNTFCFTMPGDSEMDRQHQWCDMDKQPLKPALAAELQKLMPVAQSCQDRGLWSRYASCTLYSPDDYYKRGFKLAKAIAATQVNAKIAGAMGGIVSQRALLEAFRADFGDESDNAVDFECRQIGGLPHLYEVTISVTVRALTEGLKPAFLWKPREALRRGCPDNITVDAPPSPVVVSGAGGEGAQPAGGPVTISPDGSPVVSPVIPNEPIAPDSVPIGPVEIMPLSPPAGQQSPAQ